MLSEEELEIIRRKMAELEDAPPAQAWEKIQAGIKLNRRHWPARWLVLAAVTGFLIFMGYYLYHEQNYTIAVTTTANSPSREDHKNTPLLESNRSADGKITKQKNSESGFASTDFAQERKLSKALVSPPSTQQQPVEKVIELQKDDSVTILADQLVPTTDRVNINFFKPKTYNPATTAPDHNQLNSSQRNNAIVTDSSKRKPAGLPDSIQTLVKVDSVNTKPAVPALDASFDEKQNEWSLGLIMTPTYAAKRFTPTTTDNIVITRLTSRNKFNAQRMGFELGLQFTKILNKNLHVAVGLSWLQLQENIDYTFSRGAVDSIQYSLINLSQAKIKTFDKLDNRQLISSYRYGGAQVGLIYYFITRPKSRLNVSLSGGANRLLQGSTKESRNGQWYQPLGMPASDSLFAKSNYNLSIGLGYNRKVSNTLEVRLMPSLNYFLGSTYVEQEPYRLRPYLLGLNITIIRRFGRQQ